MRNQIVSLAMLFVSTSLLSQEGHWASQVKKALDQHPKVLALKSQLSAADYQAVSMGKPLFNPAFETELEKEGDTFNYRLGFSSDLDWWGQQDERQQMGSLIKQQARYQFTVDYNALLAQLIRAQVRLHTAQKQYHFAQQQVNQNVQLIELTNKSLALGDASSTDIALLSASLIQSIAAENETHAAMVESQLALAALMPSGIVDLPKPDKRIWQTQIAPLSAAQIQRLPSIQNSHQQWLIAQQNTQVVATQSKVIPSLAMNIGEQGGNATVAMNLSIPMTIRNDYSNDIAQASELATVAQEQYRDAILQIQAQSAQLVTRAEYLQRRLRQWHDIGEQLLTEQHNTLEDRLASGNLAIADFKELQSEIRTGKQAELQLQSQYWLLVIDYLEQRFLLGPLLLKLQANPAVN